jgi:hypothetical protein
VSSVLESEQYIDACTDVLLKKMAKLSAGGDVVDIGEWIQWYDLARLLLKYEI